MKNHFIRLLISVFTVTVGVYAQNQNQGGERDITKLPILYRLPNQDQAKVQRDVVYKRVGSKDLKMDVYSPANKKANENLPAIIFISGASETKNWRNYRDFGELTAANGLIAIQFNKRYDTQQQFGNALEDTNDLIKFLQSNSQQYGIDKDKICLWVFSGGGGLITAGMQPEQPHIKCLVSYYGIGLAGPRRQVTELGDKLPPILVVRAGIDSPILNNAIDLFVQEAINKNIRFEFINYADGQHGFENLDDKERTREIIRKTFVFIKEQLK